MINQEHQSQFGECTWSVRQRKKYMRDLLANKFRESGHLAGFEANFSRRTIASKIYFTRISAPVFIRF